MWRLRAYEPERHLLGPCDADGALWFFRELYQSGLIYSSLSAKMIEMTPEPIRYTVMDPSIFGKSRDTGEVGAELMGRAGVPVVAGQNNRVEGWRHMREFLKDPPHIHVHLQNCKHWWQTVPALVYDEHNAEDVDTDGDDHCLVADTLVDTATGPQKIVDLVGTTGAVLTPTGWQNYRNVRLTRHNQELFRLVTTDGRTVMATGDHRVNVG